MIRFECDYGEGAHPRILERLAETNMEQLPGYGTDIHCQRARELIRSACTCPHAAVEFLMGGTQANLTVLTALLRPHQGAVCADSGHIEVHETGAIEATGHKVLTLPSREGKIAAEQVDRLCKAHWADPTREHTVQPGLVYLSQPTEEGTLYTRAELEAMREVCDRHQLWLYVDGARCGYGLAAPGNDVGLPELACLADAFYIGGTKVGALFGEAVVIPNEILQRDFRCFMKRQGGMLAKGRLLGLQFEVLFEDGLYQELGRHGVEMAMQIKNALCGCGVPMLHESPTNQQFPILTREQHAALEEHYALTTWRELPDGRTAVRICTSWATSQQAVEQLIGDIESICG